MGQTVWSSPFHQLAVKAQSDIHVVSVLSSGIFSQFLLLTRVFIKGNDFSK
jgi:hypothetical protein